MKYLLIILMSFFLTNLEGQSHLEMLKNAPVAEQKLCSKENQFKQTICSFKDIDTVRYKHINFSPVHDFKSVKEIIDSAIVETSLLAHKFAVEVDSTTEADLVVKYEYLDGIGGTLAHANFPSCNTDFIQTMVFDNYDIPPGENTPDSLLVYYKDPKNIKVIATHEMGHIYGCEHNTNALSMMNPFYNEDATWSQDDSLFFELNFGVTDFIKINKGDSYMITPHFNISEFFSKCEGAEVTWIDKRLIVMAERLRLFYRSPIMITSTERSRVCNKNAGGSTKSQHLACRAIDFVFVNRDAHYKFIDDVLENNYIRRILKSTKINGIGLYNKHVHIDTREKDLVIFDKRSELNKDKIGECGL